MTTRAKFKVESRKEYSYETGKVSGVEVELKPVYSDDPESENKTFWQATPNGSIQMYIENVEAAKMFQAGKEIYVDFSPAD